MADSAPPLTRTRLQEALRRAAEALWAEQSPDGGWAGELSSSALSTATAVMALAIARNAARDTASEDPSPRPSPHRMGRGGEMDRLEAEPSFAGLNAAQLSSSSPRVGVRGGPDLPAPSVLPFQARIGVGLAWLEKHVNADGGWGDTPESPSNLSTTILGWAAFGAVPGADSSHRDTVLRAERWIAAAIRLPDDLSSDLSSPEPRPLTLKRFVEAVLARYGKDRTFSIPILTACALAGRLGQGREAWCSIPSLPFELAACPHQWFAALRLPMVSYALPALIAIGQARHFHRPTRNPATRLLRNLARGRTLRILTQIQPLNGGFLEATPLTAFVTMSLAGSGLVEHPVTGRGIEFLEFSQRSDGSWPIDTNLSTWLTTLAINALGEPNTARAAVVAAGRDACRHWLLLQQFQTEHFYSHASPGGWAWTPLPGGVPDADDTAGAVLALAQLRRDAPDSDRVLAAAGAGIGWLLDLQNRDGGIPTFCRGWGALPFDRSSPDLTAHALRAWRAWARELSAPLQSRVEEARRRAIAFLARSQRPDGAWVPLWFGNQFAANDENPTCGTARVLRALAEEDKDLPEGVLLKGARWLLKAKNRDGGWGGEPGVVSSVEETALAVEALAVLVARASLPTQRSPSPRPSPQTAGEREIKGCEARDSVSGELKACPQLHSLPPSDGERAGVRGRPDGLVSAEGALLLELQRAVSDGAAWLVERVESGEWKRSAPLGLYFARLWYWERLYPVIFTVGALRQAVEMATRLGLK